jgi:hypothetical protein
MASHAEQKAFFDVAVDEVAHINSLDAHDDAGSLFWGQENIVLGVIRELFFHPEKGERVESALKIFHDDAEGRNAGDRERDGPVCVERKIVVKKVMAFKLTIDYVACGLSFRQASNILTHTARRTGLHKLRGVREEDVARFVRAIVGINLDKIASFLRRNEPVAFTIAFEGATVEGKSFLDVRIRLCVRGEVENVHLVAIPLRASHTGLKMAQV